MLQLATTFAFWHPFVLGLHGALRSVWCHDGERTPDSPPFVRALLPRKNNASSVSHSVADYVLLVSFGLVSHRRAPVFATAAL